MIALSETQEDLKRIAYLSIVLFGFISLFGDIIYEGARSIVPTYLKFLGATAIIVGLVGGLGEFIGYSLRLVSGYLADSTKAYWFFFAIGYLLLISIPLLALTNYWQIAIILVLLERTAKALRSPARDTLLSVTTKGIATGKAFGWHEFMDQLGAVTGPMIIATALYFTVNDYHFAFSTLFVPYIILAILVFAVMAKLKPYTEKAFSKLKKEERSTDQKLSTAFFVYTLAVFLNTAGLIHVSLILYVATGVAISWLVALIYLLIQAVDAVSAPISGHLYDKMSLKVLIVPFLLSIVPSILTLIGTLEMILLAAIFFGIVLGMQESIYRAAVSDLTPLGRRSTAYGIFNTGYGLGFLVSGFIFGIFIDYYMVNIAIIYSIIMQIAAIIILTASLKTK